MNNKLLLFLISISLTGCFNFDTINSSNNNNYINYSIEEENFVAYPNQPERDYELEALFDDMILKYGGSGNYIIQYMKDIADTYCSLPFIKHYIWISEETKELTGHNFFNFSLSGDVEFAVHETAHEFSFSAAYLSPEYSTSRPGHLSYSAQAVLLAVYLENWGIHYIQRSSSVPAALITPLIQNIAITEDMRYRTYIIPSEQLHENQQIDIYSLINEFHAYHYSTLVSLNRIKDPELDLSKIVDSGESYPNVINDEYLSFLQFSIYILTYFRLVESEYPEIFQELMDNNTLLEAFIRIHDASKILYTEIADIIEIKRKSSHNSDLFFGNEQQNLVNEYNLPENQNMLATIRGKVENQ